MKAFFEKVLFELNGLDPEITRRLGLKDQLSLASISLWGLAGTLLSAFSIAYIVEYVTDSTLIGTVGFVLCFFVLISLHVLLVTSSSIELNTKPSKRLQWIPTKFRPLSYFMVGLMFSQPIVLTTLSLTNNLESNVSIQSLHTQIEVIKSKYASYAALKNLKLIQIQSFRNVVDKDAPDVTVRYKKKAFLISNGDASETFNDLKEALQAKGFKVTLISKIFGEELDLKVKGYYEDINPGDISLIVFRGPSRVSSDHSLEITEPNARFLSHAVDVESLISIIANKKPLASYLFFSLPPNQVGISEASGITWSNYENTYIASQSNDSQAALLRSFVDNLRTSDELNEIVHLAIQSIEAAELTQTPGLKLPIFMSWAKGYFYKEFTSAQMENLLPAADYCKTYSKYEQITFAECLVAEERMVKGELQFIEEMRAKNIQSVEKVIAKKLKSPSVVMNYTGWVRKHGFLTFFLTLIAIVLVAGGYITRDFLAIGSIVRYETKSVQLSKICLHHEFKLFRTIIRNVRRKFSKQGEHFDNTQIQHPLYRPIIKERKKRSNSNPDDLYKTLKEALSNKKRSTL
jgi:hypothetical protein